MKKAKGPFRTGALVPSIILIALVWAYFFFFFDHHLRAGMAYGLTRVHGAEVDIASVKTSFWHASMGIYDVEVTDKEKPERNIVKIGTMRFAMLWDALLRGKVAIEDASILDIQPYVMRKNPGYVLPPPPPTESLLTKVQDQVVEQTRAQFNGNFLGDIADVVGGVDPKEQLKNLQGNLKAEARALELEKELTNKKAEWEKRIKDLPKPAEIQAIEQKIKALNMNSKNPMEIAQNVKKVKEILGEAQAKIKQVDDTQGQLTGDVQKYTSEVANLEKLAAQDVADLQKRLKIPSIDPKEFSTQLFLTQVEKKLTGIRKYIEIARKYMPEKEKKTKAEITAAKAAKEEQLVPHARSAGRTFQFPVTTGYPLFWLKKAAISSELSQSEWAGKISGELLDVTTSPSQLGRPAKLHLAGNFPKQNISGLDFLAVVDHTTEKAKESITAKVGAYPLTNQVFSDSPSVKFGIKNATASGMMSASLADQALNIKIGSRFDKPEFDFAAKSAPVQEILGTILKGIPVVTMAADVTGSWDKFNINIDSNLGKELSAGFQKQLQAKLGEAKAKLDTFVNEKIGGPKKKVQELLGGLTSGPGSAISKQKDELNKAMSSAQKSAQGGGSPAGGAKNLLKGFGF